MGKGDIAQLGERCVRNAKVAGSNPVVSILLRKNFDLHFFPVSAIIHTVRKHSSAGMSVRLTRERSWVRAPLLPCKKPRNLGVFYFHVA